MINQDLNYSMRKQRFHFFKEGISVHKHRMFSCSGSSCRVKTFKWRWEEHLCCADLAGNSLPAPLQLNNPVASSLHQLEFLFPLEIHHWFPHIRIQHMQTHQTFIQIYWCVRNPWSQVLLVRIRNEISRQDWGALRTAQAAAKTRSFKLLFKRAQPLQYLTKISKNKTKTF